MERLLRGLKTEWLPPLGYETVGVAFEHYGRYLLGDYNWKRSYSGNGGLVFSKAKQQLPAVAGFLGDYRLA